MEPYGKTDGLFCAEASKTSTSILERQNVWTFAEKFVANIFLAPAECCEISNRPKPLKPGVRARPREGISQHFTTFCFFSQHSQNFHNISQHLRETRQPQLANASGLVKIGSVDAENRPEASASQKSTQILRNPPQNLLYTFLSDL